jgi:hypothetical protein
MSTGVCELEKAKRKLENDNVKRLPLFLVVWTSVFVFTHPPVGWQSTPSG